MQDEQAASHQAGPPGFFDEEPDGGFIGFRLDGIGQIDQIGGVNHKRGDAVFLHQTLCLGNVQLAYRFAAGILGRPGIEHERICAVGKRFPDGTFYHILPAHAHMGTDDQGQIFHVRDPPFAFEIPL